MIWLARFVQIASGFIVVIAAEDRNIVAAMLGWALSTIVPLLYAIAEEKELQ